MKIHPPFISQHTSQAPFLHSVWTFDRIALAYLLCIVPPLAVSVFETGFGIGVFISLSLMTVLVWQGLFAYLRKRKMGLDWIYTALTFSLIADGSLPLWQAMLGLSFGIVVGEQVFGGRGFSFLNPVVVALAFLTFSFPGTSFPATTPWLAYATLPGAGFLILTRLISLRMFIGIFAGLIAAGLLSGGGVEATELAKGPFLFFIVFLACDPVSSASTNIGRWANGLLIGALIWLFSAPDSYTAGPDALIPAILLGSIFAPLIDTLVVSLNIFARERRHE